MEHKNAKSGTISSDFIDPNQAADLIASGAQSSKGAGGLMLHHLKDGSVVVMTATGECALLKC